MHEYAHRFPELTVLGYNPGFVPDTGLSRNAGAISRFANARLLPLLARTPLASTVETVGQQLADLAVGDPVFESGAYINGVRAEASSPESYNPQRERELVAFLDELAGGNGRKH